MPRLTKLISCCIFLCCIISVQAQTISGKVIDEDAVPLEFANVVLLQTMDSSFVAGTTTDSAGIFLFNLPVNDYILKISTLGHESIEKLINQADLGIITLKNNTVALDEAVVKGNRRTVYYQNNTLVRPADSQPKSGTDITINDNL
jgi:hypothetical protein